MTISKVEKCLDLVRPSLHSAKFILIRKPITVKDMERPSVGAQDIFSVKESMMVSNTMDTRNVGTFTELAQLLKLISVSI